MLVEAAKSSSLVSTKIAMRKKQEKPSAGVKPSLRPDLHARMRDFSHKDRSG